VSAITSSPVVALMPGARLLVGVQRDLDGGVRVYVNMRSTGIHTHVAAGESADQIESAWLGAMSHLWLTDVPDDALCDCEDGAA